MNTFLLIVPLFVIMSLGYLLRRASLLNEEFVANLNKLLTRVLLPILLFSSTSRTRIDEIGIASLSFAGALVLVTIAALIVSIPMARAARGAFVQSSFRGNLAYLGLPVVGAVIGQEAVPVAAAILVVGLIIHIALSIPLLQLLDPDNVGLDIRANLKSIGTNPLILASVAGLLFSATGLNLPYVVSEPMSLLGRAALPLALLVIGSRLSLTNVRDRCALSLLAAAFKLVVMPGIAYLLTTRLLEAQTLTTQVVVIMAASPTAILAQTFAEAFNADGRLAASTVALSTLLAAVALPLWSSLLGLA